MTYKKDPETALTDFLTKGRFRKTPERYAILRKAMTMTSHFEAEALHEALENDGYHVSRATVYNTVELLVRAGILRKNVFSSGTALYEMAHDNHIHLVCRRCGKIREINNRHIADHILALDAPGFHAENFAVTITGLCEDCMVTDVEN